MPRVGLEVTYLPADVCLYVVADYAGQTVELYIADFDCWDYGDVVQGSE